jgi:hypothetical protein
LDRPVGNRRSIAARQATKAGPIGTGLDREKVKGTESPPGLLLQRQNG